MAEQQTITRQPVSSPPLAGGATIAENPSYSPQDHEFFIDDIVAKSEGISTVFRQMGGQ